MFKGIKESFVIKQIYQEKNCKGYCRFVREINRIGRNEKYKNKN